LNHEEIEVPPSLARFNNVQLQHNIVERTSPQERHHENEEGCAKHDWNDESEVLPEDKFQVVIPFPWALHTLHFITIVITPALLTLVSCCTLSLHLFHICVCIRWFELFDFKELVGNEVASSKEYHIHAEHLPS
jgi:hypothetical protein